MKIWIFSDLHLEQSDWDLLPRRPEHDVIVAAGDIHFATEAACWLADRARGAPVVFVPGNHEWYGYGRRLVIEEELPAARGMAAQLGIHFLWDDEVVFGGVRFLGTPLWTDFALYGTTSASMAHAKARMNDHYCIFPRADLSPLTPEEVCGWHVKSRTWLEEKLAEQFDGQTVVVTHHLPHPRSIAPQYAGDPLTPAFCSDLSQLVESGGAALWIHGHTHSSCDYKAGQTRVLCNPKGYGPRSQNGSIENVAFNEQLVVEV